MLLKYLYPLSIKHKYEKNNEGSIINLEWVDNINSRLKFTRL